MTEESLKKIYVEMARFPSMSVSERYDLLRTLQPYVDAERIETTPKGQPSICPYTKQSLTVACGLKKCMFWVKQESCRNCTLNFMLEGDVDRLSTEQLSFLYGKSPDRIDSIYKRCFKIVQRHYLKNRLREQGTPRFTRIPGFCVACESRLEPEDLENPQLYLGDGFGYCSAACKKVLPPQNYEIESFFETEFMRIVEVGSEMFNFHYLEEILGFQPNILRGRLETARKKQF